MALPTIDFNEFTVDDLLEALKNSGYVFERREFDFAVNAESIKYLGYAHHNHVFAIPFEDEEKDEEDERRFYVSHLYLHLGNGGKFYADFGGCPAKDELTAEEAYEYVQNDKLK